MNIPTGGATLRLQLIALMLKKYLFGLTCREQVRHGEKRFKRAHENGEVQFCFRKFIYWKLQVFRKCVNFVAVIEMGIQNTWSLNGRLTIIL